MRLDGWELLHTKMAVRRVSAIWTAILDERLNTFQVIASWYHYSSISDVEKHLYSINFPTIPLHRRAWEVRRKMLYGVVIAHLKVQADAYTHTAQEKRLWRWMRNSQAIPGGLMIYLIFRRTNLWRSSAWTMIRLNFTSMWRNDQRKKKKPIGIVVHVQIKISCEAWCFRLATTQVEFLLFI